MGIEFSERSTPSATVQGAADPAVDRAVGVLLDRGYPPDEARQELADQARASGRSRFEQARRILRSPT
jgi:hypothetical protein